MTARVTALRRQLANLESELEPIINLLRDPGVTDLMANPDGSLWVKTQGRVTRRVGNLDRENIMRIILFTASLLNTSVNACSPEIDGIIPLENLSARISAFIPPWSIAPTFCIRKLAGNVFSLSSYVESGRMTAEQAEAVTLAANNKRNIVVSGGTGSGKTTFLNTVLDHIAASTPDDRIYIVEDTPEIQCRSPNQVSLVVPPETTAHAVRKALRYFPDRIVFGELRYGETARELLKAWNTGHPGGLSTVHANSAESARARLLNLLHEVISSSRQCENLVDDSLDMVVQMENGGRVREIKIIKEFKQ